MLSERIQKSKPISEINSSIQILDKNLAKNESSTSILRPTIPAAPTIPNLHGNLPRKKSECAFWHDASSIKHPSDTSSIKHSCGTSSVKHPCGTTRTHGLNFTTENLRWPNFTNAKHSLPANENQQLKFLFLALEQQLLGRQA